MGSLEESVVEIGGNGIGAAVMRSLQEEEEEASASPPQQPIVYVNGKRHVLPSDSAHRTLLEYLRGLCFVLSQAAAAALLSFFLSSSSSIPRGFHLFCCNGFLSNTLESP
jgi:hypothetical protein